MRRPGQVEGGTLRSAAATWDSERMSLVCPLSTQDSLYGACEALLLAGPRFFVAPNRPIGGLLLPLSVSHV